MFTPVHRPGHKSITSGYFLLPLLLCNRECECACVSASVCVFECKNMNRKICPLSKPCCTMQCQLQALCVRISRTYSSLITEICLPVIILMLLNPLSPCEKGPKALTRVPLATVKAHSFLSSFA